MIAKRRRETPGQPTVMDPQARWMAKGLGVSAAELTRLQAGREAGEDAGELFYTLSLSEMSLAIRRDGLRVYLTKVSGEAAEETDLEGVFKKYHLATIGVPPHKIVEKSLLGASQPWLKVAEGHPPQDGEDAQVEILVDLERRAGQEREDGSIDFRAVNFTPNVKAGQLVARRTSPIPGAPGRDVLGRVLPAEEGKDRTLQAGDNIQVEREGGVEQFFATTDGALRVSGDELSVVELLEIKGDVSFNTGNLSFGGEVYVDGSVVQGFSVKAAETITVTGTVQPGAEVISQADITVGRGIVGRKTRVIARGSVRAQFAQEATLRAGKDIFSFR